MKVKSLIFLVPLIFIFAIAAVPLHGADKNTQGKYIYVTNAGNNTVSVIDTAKLSLAPDSPYSGSLWGIAVY